jgi:arabinofuranan 3-O-arabinosyltransferase
MTAAAVATPGAALDGLISSLAPASRSTFQVVASSTWDSLPDYSPDNLFNPASSSPWIASSADPNPMLHITWRGARTIGEMVLSPASGSATFPAQVEVASPQGIRVANVGPGGVVRLEPPLRTSQLYVTFPGTQTVASTVGGQPVLQPVGLSKLTIPGLAGLHVAAPDGAATFRLACGRGPAVSVDGKTYPTSVTGTVADLIRSLPVQVELCTPGGQLYLSGGQHWLRAAPTSVFTVTDLDLSTQPSTSADSSGGQRSVQALTWQADNRSVSIGPGAESYLEIHENFNAGWTATLNGKPLAATRLDGWQQAFIVPAGSGGVITLTYSPAVVYHAGIIASALALLILAAAAIGLGRRRRQQRGRRQPDTLPTRNGPRGQAPGARIVARAVLARAVRTVRAVLAVAVLAVVIWLAGGAAVIAVPILAIIGWWRPRWLPPVALLAMLIAGIAAAISGGPATMGSGAFGSLAQACSLVALTAALMPAIGRAATRPAVREERAA